MAKGNMLQGMARGKVGDVVFSRLNGEQIARVRNRNPKNPRTNAQLFQRAIMATVMQAYSAGKVIFDHSFQGVSVGEANQRVFMSKNAKHLRSLLAADLNNDTTEVAVVGPGVSSPVPTPLIVSDGNYPQNSFTEYGDIEAPRQGDTFAQYYERKGLVPGDIHTIVAFVSDEDHDPLFVVNGVDDRLAKQYAADFRYVRLQVKAYADGTATISGDTLMSAVFDLTDSKGLTGFDYATAKLSDLNGDGRLSSNMLISSLVSTDVGCVGVIRSRLDEDLRSRTVLTHVNDDETGEENPNGITAQYALQAWKQGTEKIGDSDLILEGGNQ